MNQLIAKVSSVPRVRQLMALRTDLVCVSAPRNEPTRDAPCLTMSEPNTPTSCACPPHVLRSTTKHICGSSTNKFAKNGKVTNTIRDEAHFAQRNPTNPLIKLSNRDL